jgi:hypothetical protein
LNPWVISIYKEVQPEFSLDIFSDWTFSDYEILCWLFCSFEERLAAQRKEREIAAAELGFKKPLSKEERVMKKKQRLAAIGKSSG